VLQLGRIALTDRRGIILKPLTNWTADEAALLDGYEVLVKNQAGDHQQDLIKKVHLAKAIPAIELLLKKMGP
jgi:hypothetical protein